MFCSAWTSCAGLLPRQIRIQVSSQMQKTSLLPGMKEQDLPHIPLFPSEADQGFAWEMNMLDHKYLCSCITLSRDSNGIYWFLMRKSRMIQCLLHPKVFQFDFSLTNPLHNMFSQGLLNIVCAVYVLTSLNWPKMYFGVCFWPFLFNKNCQRIFEELFGSATTAWLHFL